MREVATTFLDAVGLLGVAAGVGAGAAQWLGWWGLAVAGALVLAGSWFSDRQGDAPAAAISDEMS